MTLKFSQFVDGGELEAGETIVGLNNLGQNTKFTMPDITITSTGDGYSVVYTESAPDMVLKGFTAGPGITIDDNGTNLQINNSSPASDISDSTFVTLRDETSVLPNSFPLSTLATGFMSVETVTGALNARTFQQTANQINISNASGLAGNPSFSLSSTLVFPGTMSFGGSSATINNIDNTGTSFLSTDTMTALAIQTAISDQIDMGTSFRGGWDASGGTFPTTGGTGTAGAIESGNWWFITVAGTLNGIDVSVGDEITALVNSPGQTGSNWLVSAQKVTSVFNRDGPVVAELGDYDIGKITNGINNTIAWVYSNVADGGAPLPSYDFTVGFLHGSFYRDSVTGYNYVCIDAGEDAAVWEKLCPTSASYTNNSLALNVNGNETNTEIVPLSPTNVTYLAANGNDATARVNSFAFPFSTLQSAADAITALADEIGNVLHIYSKSSGGAYGNLSLDGFNGWEILGFGDYVSAGDIYIADESVSSSVSSAFISNVYWNNLSMTNYHDQVDGVTFRFGAFNDYVLENDASATNGVNIGNKFIDMEFVGGIIYFPSGYAKQITSITETYIGCKFGSTMTINGTATNVKFVYCQNIPTILYANGATSAQVTIIGNIASAARMMWRNGGTGATGVSITSTPSEQNNPAGLNIPYTLSSDTTSDWQVINNGRLEYIGTAARKIMVSGFFSANNSSRIYEYAVYKNGTTIIGQAQYTLAAYQMQATPITIYPGDYLSIFISRPTTVTETFWNYGVSVWSID